VEINFSFEVGQRQVSLLHPGDHKDAFKGISWPFFSRT